MATQKGNTTIPQKAKDKNARERIGATVMNRVGESIKDRLDLRPESRVSTDSGIHATSPPPMENSENMESSENNNPFSQPLVQTLCGVELNAEEVPDSSKIDEKDDSKDKDKEIVEDDDDILEKDFPDCPDLYQDVFEPVETEAEQGKDIEKSKLDQIVLEQNTVPIPEIVVTNVTDITEEQETCKETEKVDLNVKASDTDEKDKQETEQDTKVIDSKKEKADKASEKKNSSAQDRLRKRKDIKESIQQKAAHQAMLDKINIKREKIDECEHAAEDLDNFVWSGAQVFDFLKTTMPRPDQHPRAYSFSLLDKLDKSKVIDKKIQCDGCKQSYFMYRFGDTINILLTSSTMAGMKFKDKEKGKDYKCSHFEYLVIRGGNFLDMERIACPMINYLKCYFNVTVLVVCGINDLNDDSLSKDPKKDPYNGLIDRVNKFNVSISRIITRPKTELEGVKYHPGDMSVKYICIPYPPKFTRLHKEFHAIKHGINRTKDVSNLNRYLKGLNNKSFPQTRVPTMEMLGITEEPLQAGKPARNTHIFEEWHHKDNRWPKDKSLTKEVVHLRHSIKYPVWKAIHQYFQNIY